MSNGYIVFIQNFTAGWAEYVLSGVDPDPADRVVIVDGLKHSWSFVDEAVPNPLEPATLQFGMAARSTADLPVCEVGDLVIVTVDLVDIDLETDMVTHLGARAVEFVGRLSEPIVDLNPASGWPARLSLVATDVLADAHSIFPPAGSFSLNTGAGWSIPWVYSWLSGVVNWRYSTDIWYPVQWFTDRDTLPFIGREIGGGIPQASLYEILTKCGLGVPLHDGSVWIPRYRYAPDRSVPDPAVWRVAGIDTGHPKLTNPVGWIYQRIDDTPPGSRLPYELTGPAPGGPVTLELDSDPTLMAGIAVIPARAVEVPTTARRSRDTNVNTYVINGYSYIVLGGIEYESSPTSITVTTSTRSPSTRAIDTYAEVDMSNPNNIANSRWGTTPPSVRRVQMQEIFDRAYRPDDAATSASWAYDVLHLDTRGLTIDEYAAIVPMLNSWAPERGDGVCVRPVLIHDVAADVALAPFRNIMGRLVAAELTITRGHIEVDMKLTPGAAPMPRTGSNAITAADLLASPYASTPANEFDPGISALDMRYVRAS